MRRTFWLSMVGLMLTMLAAFAVPAASADSGAGINALRKFRNANSNMCLDIDHASLAPGANALQWPCIPEANQVFEEIPNSRGGVYLRVQHSDQCLDVFNADRTPGARVIQWPCNLGENQRFFRTFYSDGSVRLRAAHSGLCVDIVFGSTQPAVIAIQWNCHNGASQRWF